jgi:Ca2+-binding RTX toxin-like protein
MARFFMASSRSDVLMTLTAPSGRVIDAGTVAPDLLHDRSTTFEQYTLLNPEQGKWLVALYSMPADTGTEVAEEGEAVAFTLSTEDAPPPARPALAYVDQDGRLVLNMGSEERRAARLANIEVVNEAFAVTQLSRDLPGQFAVTAFGITQVYNGVSQIVADGADGDDIIALLAGVDEAGVPVPFTAPAQINGGEGNDQIQGGDGADTLTGGDGDDVVSGGGGDDEISGGKGSDTLNGEAGFDLLNGDPTDALIAGGTEVWRLWPEREDRRCQSCE